MSSPETSGPAGGGSAKGASRLDQASGEFQLGSDAAAAGQQHPLFAAARVTLGASIVVVTLLGAVRWVVGGESYLLFHSLAECFSVAVASGVFMLAYNARLSSGMGFLLVLGAGYLPVAVLDLLHALTYQGMGVLSTEGPNLATELWIAARYIETVALVSAVFALRTSPRPWLVLLAGIASGGGLALLIFSGAFPDCFVPGEGLTAFKIGSEYLISAVLLGAGYLLHRRRAEIASEPYSLMISAIGTTIVSELLFTLYVDPYGATNQLGHVLKVVSYYLVYRAVFEVGLRKPLTGLLREVEEQRRALEASNAELELYARTVSHDLRTPLSAISSAAGLIRMAGAREAAPPATVDRALAVIERNVQASVELVDDLLLLARAGSGAEPAEPVEVGSVLQRIVEERADELTRAGLRVELDADLGRVTAAPAHLHQVFSNLLNNAIAHAGGQATLVEVKRLPSRAGQQRYLVCDDGPGIPEEHLGRIFKPFFSGRVGGTGIGLAIVQRIVARYEGEIRAYNDGGACFELSFGRRAPR